VLSREFLKPLASAISNGSGSPFGAEGPIIMTGGAFGSLIAPLFHVTRAERKTLFVAGAAAEMSATFAAPVASVLLAVELFLFEQRNLLPVTLASAAVAVLRRDIFLDSAPPEHPCGDPVRLADLVGLRGGRCLQYLPIHSM
jgi:H+/Cl- antiporter ClcA